MIFELIYQYWVEALAAILAIIYLLLAVQQDVKCWSAAILSSSLYFYVMYSAGLYMEAYLQIFYIIMAIYGWSQWYNPKSEEQVFVVRTWKINQHFLAIFLIVIMAYLSGSLLNIYTNAAFPFIDSLTTWGAIFATYMVAKKLLENWVYWFVIDSISVMLFMSRGLILTSLLFFIYLFIIYFGYKKWTKARDEMNGRI